MIIKKGGNNIDNFIINLLKDKTSHLAFLLKITEMSEEIINKDKIYEGFKECSKILEEIEYNNFRNNKSYNTFGYLLSLLNDKYNNINYNNYGSETQILDFIENSRVNYYLKLEEYLNGIKSIDEIKDKEYNLENYMKKIGFDIAIYIFIFINNNNYYIYNNYYFIKIFETYLKQGLKEIEEKEFEKKLVKEMKKILENTEIQQLTLKENILLELQQYYNIYKYPYRKINNINILFNNTTLINIEETKYNNIKEILFSKKIIKITTFFKEEIKNIIKNLLKKIKDHIQNKTILKINLSK